jgi:hypothetical protein
LSFINPLTKVETPIVAADWYSSPTKKAIPAGLVIYTPATTPTVYVGADAFTFVAHDGTSPSAAATVNATVRPAENAVTEGLTRGRIWPSSVPMG